MGVVATTAVVAARARPQSRAAPGAGSGWGSTDYGDNVAFGTSGGAGGTPAGSTKGGQGSIDVSIAGQAIAVSLGNQTSGLDTTVNVTPTLNTTDPNSGFSCCTWQAIGLPPGVSINASSGALTGEVTSAGSYPVTLITQGYDSSTSYIDSTSFTWSVTSVSLSPGSPVNGLGSSVDTTFSATENANGGSATCCTWSATGLPAGLSLNAATGVVTGAPTTAGRAR